MLQTLKRFLSKRWDRKSPLLLGYSGGPDSKALLFALLDAGLGSYLHLAHVDHSWREQSKEEALRLREEAERLSLPFYLKKIPAQGEAASREERLSFFRSLFEKIPFQALLLAHHANDGAETTLKRVLEGAHLCYLSGMDPCSKIHGMAVWRPFLFEPRQRIIRYLEKKQIGSFVDPSNCDPAYLRARMRLEILPQLQSAFGKNIGENLSLLGARARELREYLGRRTANIEEVKGPFGSYIDLRGMERIEARYLLQGRAKLSRSSLERALDGLKMLQCIQIAEGIFIDRGFLFFLSKNPPRCPEQPLSLALGSLQFGDWTLHVEKSGEETPVNPSWKEVWSGRFTATAPKGALRSPSGLALPRRLLSNGKVPSFLRPLVPVAMNERGEVKEFLSGKILPEIGSSFKLNFSTCSGPVS